MEVGESTAVCPDEPEYGPSIMEGFRLTAAQLEAVETVGRDMADGLAISIDDARECVRRSMMGGPGPQTGQTDS